MTVDLNELNAVKEIDIRLYNELIEAALRKVAPRDTMIQLACSYGFTNDLAMKRRVYTAARQAYAYLVFCTAWGR